MANITKQGRGYKITVSAGYGSDGKQIRKYMTWVPEPGMTQRQIEKELAKQAVLFEERARGGFLDNRIKLADFTAKYISDYAALYLKPKTLQTYTENLEVILAALGHIRLCDLKTSHINSFYKNLQEGGMRRRTVAACRFDLAGYLVESKLSLSRLAGLSGASCQAIRTAMDGGHISCENAEKISAAVGIAPADAFERISDPSPLTPATVLSYHHTLSSVLSKAVKWGYLQFNPADAAERPSLGRREAPYLEEDEARQLLKLLQDEPIKWRAIITFDLLSGLRRGEILGLRWCDVDFADCTITVRQTSNYLSGQGVYIGTPKTASSERPLKLSRAAMSMLLEYRQWQDAQREALGDAWEDQDGRVFTTDTGAPVFPDSVTQWFTRFVKRSGLPKVTVHSLRHTYATLMIADGTPLVVVSWQLGHAQTSTTSNIYAHAIASARAKAAQTFDRFNDLVIPTERDEAGITAAHKKNKAAGG